MKKGYYEDPKFKLCRGSWGPTFKILGGLRVPLLNFEGGLGSRVPGYQSPGSRGPGPTFTPCLYKKQRPKIIH